MMLVVWVMMLLSLAIVTVAYPRWFMALKLGARLVVIIALVLGYGALAIYVQVKDGDVVEPH